MNLRWAQPEDLPQLVELICAAYAVERFFVRGARTNLQEVREFTARGRFLIAEQAGDLAATVFVQRRSSSVPLACTAKQEVGYFGMLAVSPNHQGGGLGRAMVGHAETWTLEQGLVTQEIWTVDLRVELVAWYQRLGYQLVGTEPFDAPARKIRPCHFVVLHKPLGSA